MPGAPNRPPETSAPAPPPVVEPPERRALRRLAPARIALSLDVWKGAPSAELLTPLQAAETAYAAGDWREAESRLDALSVRFAEPRWPTMPEPFRQLRVSIPAPQPPQWDPEFALPSDEKEARKARRGVEVQVVLVRASVQWAQQKGLDVTDLTAPVASAAEKLSAGASTSEVYAVIDPVWEALRSRVPMPKPPTARPPPPPAREPPAEEA